MNTIYFFTKLQKSGIHFFTGVPDSLLKQLGNCIYDKVALPNHVIAANEGNAIALAAGNYIATGNIPVVYLQNSGLGNTVNPLLSMADKNLYAIPMIIFVGWRGKDGLNDAEQHLRQGKVTPPLIETMGYPYEILDKDDETAHTQVDKALELLKKDPQPFFFIVEEGTFDSYKREKAVAAIGTMSREEALQALAKVVPSDYL